MLNLRITNNSQIDEYNSTTIPMRHLSMQNRLSGAEDNDLGYQYEYLQPCPKIKPKAQGVTHEASLLHNLKIKL
jgi:hypothetical protein